MRSSAAWQQEKASLTSQLAEAQARMVGLEATAARFEQLTALTDPQSRGSNPGSADAALHSMSRELVALQVATPLIVRKYNLLKAELATARTAARTAEVRRGA